MAEYKCKTCGEVHRSPKVLRLPFVISRNLAIIEVIFLQLTEIDVETIYTLGYILKMYPLLFPLKTVKRHYDNVQRRLKNCAEIDSVMQLHMLVLGKPSKRQVYIPNISVYEYKEGSGTLFATAKHWGLELRTHKAYNYFVLDTLVGVY